MLLANNTTCYIVLAKRHVISVSLLNQPVFIMILKFRKFIQTSVQFEVCESLVILRLEGDPSTQHR